jgi:fatty acid synthase
LQVGDAEELKAITLAFCKDRKTPLLIGSIKSNMGHTEPASGLCGVTKVIIAMETGFIPPNLHYKNPSEGVESLVNGQLKVNVYITPECLQSIFILSYT